jgi:hypothetical protein
MTEILTSAVRLHHFRFGAGKQSLVSVLAFYRLILRVVWLSLVSASPLHPSILSSNQNLTTLTFYRAWISDRTLSIYKKDFTDFPQLLQKNAEIISWNRSQEFRSSPSEFTELDHQVGPTQYIVRVIFDNAKFWQLAVLPSWSGWLLSLCWQHFY